MWVGFGGAIARRNDIFDEGDLRYKVRRSTHLKAVPVNRRSSSYYYRVESIQAGKQKRR